MILCHKCSGILSNQPQEDVTGLHSCECISGWVRGFEPHLGRLEAIQEQIKQCDVWIVLKIRQGGQEGRIEFEQKRKKDLQSLLGLR